MDKMEFIKDFINKTLRARGCKDFSLLMQLLEKREDLNVGEFLSLINYLETKHTQIHIGQVEQMLKQPIIEFTQDFDPIEQERENLNYLLQQEFDKIVSGKTHKLETVKKVLKS